MQLSLHFVSMNLGVKRLLQLGIGSRKYDEHVAMGNGVDAHPVGLQPARYGSDGLRRHSELIGIRCGRKPVVILRRFSILLRGEQILKRDLLFPTSLQEKDHVLQRQISGCRS